MDKREEGRMRRALAVSLVLLAFSATCAEEKALPPDTKAQKDTEKTIKDLFRVEYAKPAPADRLALAQKLLQQGIATNDDQASKYVLLREARDLAAQGGDADTAMKAIEEMARVFVINEQDEKAAALAKTETAARTSDAAKALTDRYLELTDQAVAADKYDVAFRFATKAEAAARNGQDVSLMTKAKEKTKSVQDIQREASNAATAMKTLEKTPDDPAANTTVGRFLAFFKGDPEKGFALLAKGSDPALKALAEKEVTKPQDGNAQIALADEWWDLGEKQSGIMRALFKQRAVNWYRIGARTASGLAKTKAYARIDAFDVAWSAANPRYVNLLPLIDVKRDAKGGATWKIANGANGPLVCDCDAGCYAVRLTIMYQPPEEYDFRIVFSKPQERGDVGQALYKSRHQFVYWMNPKRSGIQMKPGGAAYESVVERPDALQPDCRYASVVQVRNDMVRAYLDGQLIIERKADYKEAELFTNFTLYRGEAVGLEVAWGSVVFHRVELIEVTGKGQRLK
jgi:hypothetical protein